VVGQRARLTTDLRAGPALPGLGARRHLAGVGRGAVLGHGALGIGTAGAALSAGAAVAAGATLATLATLATRAAVTAGAGGGGRGRRGRAGRGAGARRADAGAAATTLVEEVGV